MWDPENAGTVGSVKTTRMFSETMMRISVLLLLERGVEEMAEVLGIAVFGRRPQARSHGMLRCVLRVGK